MLSVRPHILKFNWLITIFFKKLIDSDMSSQKSDLCKGEHDRTVAESGSWVTEDYARTADLAPSW